MHAVRDIVEGEQLFVVYTDSLCRAREQRREQLQRWGFVCACAACVSEESGALETGRERMLVLDQVLAMYFRVPRAQRGLLGSQGKPEVVLEKAKELIRLLEEQELGGVELSRA